MKKEDNNLLEFLKGFFTKHLALKILSFILALLIWFYIVNELNKGSNEELQALRKIMTFGKESDRNINVKTRR